MAEQQWIAVCISLAFTAGVATVAGVAAVVIAVLSRKPRRARDVLRPPELPAPRRSEPQNGNPIGLYDGGPDDDEAA